MGLRERFKSKALNSIDRVRAKFGTPPSAYTTEDGPKLGPFIKDNPPMTRAAIDPPAVTAPPEAPAVVEEQEPDTLEGGSDLPDADDAECQDISERVVEAIKTVFDPEIPVNIYELGLIYGVAVSANRTVDVTMTLTSPNCPAAQTLPEEVKQKSDAVDGAHVTKVEIVWDPPWDPSMMSEAAQLELNLM